MFYIDPLLFCVARRPPGSGFLAIPSGPAAGRLGRQPPRGRPRAAAGCPMYRQVRTGRGCYDTV